MKKGMAVILAAVTALSLTACGGSGTAGNTERYTESVIGDGRGCVQLRKYRYGGGHGRRY